MADIHYICNPLYNCIMTEKEKYYMFVDECGDQNLTSLDENFPIFTLCGVLMSHSQLRAMEGKISALKKKVLGR